ncbi:hypothetical protein GN956_G19299 [Arapaima gigas]
MNGAVEEEFICEDSYRGAGRQMDTVSSAPEDINAQKAVSALTGGRGLPERQRLTATRCRPRHHTQSEAEVRCQESEKLHLIKMFCLCSARRARKVPGRGFVARVVFVRSPVAPRGAVLCTQ